MRKIASYLAGAVFAFGIQVQTAQAVPVQFCSSGGIDLVNVGCISGTSDGYTNGGDGIYQNTGGGDPEAKVEEAILGATGMAVDIGFFGKDNSPLVSLTSDTDNFTGTWTISDNTAIRFITIKAANSFALFDVENMSSGSWSTAGLLTPNGRNQPGLSHISFWTAPIASVPVPAAGLMLLAGLGGIGALRRRKPA